MNEKTEKLRFGKTSALLFTIVFMAFYYYGLRAVAVAAVASVSSVIADYLSCAAMKKKFDWGDLSPLMSGLLLALLMPASAPYTVVAFSAAFMASVCKHAFGGNKNLIFCPVCVAYIFTCLCFPSYIMRYPQPVPFGSVPMSNIVGEGLTHSYTYFLDNGATSAINYLDIIWGKLAGPMGTSNALIILICALALYFFGDIRPAVFFAGFASNVFINVLFPFGEAGLHAVFDSLAAGSFMFVFVFMACDPRYVPKRIFSQILYGVLFAAAAYLIRRYTSIENGAVFALPLLCIFRDEFDRLTSALERLIKFIWKHTKIFARFAWKNIKIFVKSAAKFIAKAFDSLCEYISDRIVEAGKKRREAKSAAEKQEEKPEEKPEESEEKPEEEPSGDKEGSGENE